MWCDARRYQFCNPLARFQGYVAPCPPVDIGTIPSGYAQVISGTTEPSPLMVAQDPSVGSFIRGAAIPVDAIGGPHPTQYVPAYIVEAVIGVFGIGMSAIGYHKPYHGTLSFSHGDGIGQFVIGRDAISPYAIETEAPWPTIGVKPSPYTTGLITGTNSAGW